MSTNTKSVADYLPTIIESFLLFRVSSAVEQWTVNPLVVGSNPTPGVLVLQAVRFKT